MADEAIVGLEQDDQVVMWTVADATAIAKGTLMCINESATRTAIAHDGTTIHKPCGFAVSEKEALDGQTEMGVQRLGVVDATAGDTIDEGDLVAPDNAANRLVAITMSAISGEDLHYIVGQALEAATDGTQFKCRLRL